MIIYVDKIPDNCRDCIFYYDENWYNYGSECELFCRFHDDLEFFSSHGILNDNEKKFKDCPLKELEK